MSAAARVTAPVPAPGDRDGARPGHRRTWLIGALVAAVALLAGSVAGTVAWARADLAGASAGSTGSVGTVPRLGGAGSHGGTTAGRISTAVPALPGTTVQVTAVDMGSMMGRARMRLVVDRASVPAGTVSLVLRNAGFKAHELVVLPLADGQQPGTRAVGADQKVDETGSLGEASRAGAAGAGDGVEPGTAGWVTLVLPAGRYELVCNLPGHYAAGMYAELTVD